MSTMHPAQHVPWRLPPMQCHSHLQVLSDPAQRGLYDLQHDKGSAGFLRQAAAQKRLVLSEIQQAGHARGPQD
jgi:hypothetical protein